MNYETLIIANKSFHEGNLIDMVDIIIGDNFPLTNLSDITFVVDNAVDNTRLVYGKKSNNKITVVGQRITISLLPTITKGKSGNYVYEIDFLNAESYPIWTIKGTITIEPEINNL